MKQRDDCYYVKRGRRYEPVGERFCGFPADGLWLVINDCKNTRLVIPLSELPGRPDWIRRSQLELLKDECGKAVLALTRREGPRNAYYPSVNDSINAVFDVISHGQKASHKKG